MVWCRQKGIIVSHFSLQHIFNVTLKIFGEGFLDENVQLKVDNNLNCHNVVKLVDISTIQLSIGVHFEFGTM